MPKLIGLPPRLLKRITVDPITKCWVYKGSSDRSGYGYFGALGQHFAHRVSYVVFKGPIPEGLLVLHKCDNPPCCNPDHLWVGTQLENQADMKAKDRQAKGEDNGNSVITEETVLAIRKRFIKKRGRQTRTDLAKEFGMSRSQVSVIVSSEQWKHVPSVQELTKQALETIVRKYVGRLSNDYRAIETVVEDLSRQINLEFGLGIVDSTIESK